MNQLKNGSNLYKDMEKYKFKSLSNYDNYYKRVFRDKNLTAFIESHNRKEKKKLKKIVIRQKTKNENKINKHMNLFCNREKIDYPPLSVNTELIEQELKNKNSNSNTNIANICSKSINKNEEDGISPIFRDDYIDPKKQNQIRLMKNNNINKYQVSQKLRKFIIQQHNLVPPPAFYYPKYKLLDRHCPNILLRSRKIVPSKSSNSLNMIYKNKSLFNDSSLETITQLNNNSNSKKLDSLSSYSIDDNKNNNNNNNNLNKSNLYSVKSSSSLLSVNNKLNNALSFEKYSSRKELFPHSNYGESNINPKKIQRNIPHLDFNRMSPRNRGENKGYKYLEAAIPIYKPNYECVFVNYKGYKRDDSAHAYKKKLLQKLQGNYNYYRIGDQYMLVPELNNNNNIKENNI